MKLWKEHNIRAFRITLEDGTITGLQGPNLTVDDVVDHIFKIHPYHRVCWNTAVYNRRTNVDNVKIEEYFQGDSIQSAIDNQLRQIEICRRRISELEAEREMLKT